MQPDIRRHLIITRLRLAPRWLAACARRSPRKAVGVLAVFVLAAGLAVLAVHGPAQGCSWRGVAVPGERAHWICMRTEGRSA
jgi:hypothetical protein